MNKVECTGTETSLEQCRFRGWGISECNHTEDAAVICQSSELSFYCQQKQLEKSLQNNIIHTT